jgi:hypothetical protein
LDMCNGRMNIFVVLGWTEITTLLDHYCICVSGFGKLCVGR